MAGSFASRSVRVAHAKLAPLCSDLDLLVRNPSISDGLELGYAEQKCIEMTRTLPSERHAEARWRRERFASRDRINCSGA